jgi:hypothetical protein
MKSTTFARLALFLPYLILVESAVYFIFYDINQKDSLLQTFNIAWNFLAVFWFLPYTILVIILLARSKGKPFPEVKRLFLSAPFRLMFIAPASYVVILILGSMINRDFFDSGWRLLLFATAVSVPASLLLGYAFLGISLLLLKLLLKIGIIRDDDAQQMGIEIQNQQSPS